MFIHENKLENKLKKVLNSIKIPFNTDTTKSSSFTKNIKFTEKMESAKDDWFVKMFGLKPISVEEYRRYNR